MTNSNPLSAQDILHFWFKEFGPDYWFKKDAAFDAVIRERFLEIHKIACAAELWQWRAEPLGRLAEIIILDQFSRNLFRDDARAFAQDAMALSLAQEAVAQGADEGMTQQQRQMLYMPYMHSESLAVHDEAIRLFTNLGQQEVLHYEKAHRDVIAQFGRYPHRNAVLKRPSTPAELAFLKEHPSF